MKNFALAAALLAGTSLTTSTPASAQAGLSPEACQPLTSSNLEECCAAENWRDIIRPEDFAFCPPLSANDDERLDQELADTDDDEPDDVDDGTDDDTTTGIGNPGNEPGTSFSGPGREVGGAGEDPSGRGMDSQSGHTGASDEQSGN
jgi:hypothetical protein